MDTELHINAMRDELNAAVVEEIKSRYRQGIASLTLLELPEARYLWKSQEFFGVESVRMAMERVVFDEQKKAFVDGIATGAEYGRNDPLDWGFYWSSKLSDQVFENAFEFGPSPCTEPMLTKDEKQFLSNQLIDQDIARFVFAAMKYIALARSDRQNTLNLANHWYFISVAKGGDSDFVEHSAEVLRKLLKGRGYQIDLLSIRQGLFSKKPELPGGVDVVVRWEKRQF